MAEPSRYRTDDKSEDVLNNKLRISNENDLHEAENILLKDSYRHFADELEQKKLSFSSDLLMKIHRHFLGPLYTWAGKLRTVDISKDSTLFASSRFIPELLKDFDKQLRKQLPEKDDSKKEIAAKLAYIHNELNAIHPFREGNGRTLRLFLDLLAIDVGYEPINYSASNMKSYFDACKAGMMGNNKPMESFIYKGLTKRK